MAENLPVFLNLRSLRPTTLQSQLRGNPLAPEKIRGATYFTSLFQLVLLLLSEIPHNKTKPGNYPNLLSAQKQDLKNQNDS